MDSVEERLAQQKLSMDNLEIPEDFEARLRRAVYDRAMLKRGRVRKMVLVAACILLLIIASQSDTLAYYGQRLLGYDQVMNGTLQELNKLGKGQKIEQSYQFKNGPLLTLDGVMLDDNQLIAFYTIKGSAADFEHIYITDIDGKLFSYNYRSYIGELTADGTAIKYLASFDPPYFIEKELCLRFVWEDPEARAGTVENGQISFTLNRKQAMGHTLKKEINHSVNIAGREIRFESILASPTSTVVKGVIQYPWELARDQISGERIRPQTVEIQLIANGHIMSALGSGMSTNMNGIRFKHEFDTLPAHLEKLQIQLKSLVADYDVNKKVAIHQEGSGQTVKILGQDMVIDQLQKINGDSYLTISSSESLVLTRVYMIIDGKKTSLEDTTSDLYEKKTDGSIVHTRTLKFKGTGQKLALLIERMTYKANCSEKIDIPVN